MSHPRTLFAPPTSGSQYGPVGLVAANLGVFASSQQPTYSQVRTYDNRQRLFSETNQQAASGGALVYSYVVGFTPNSNIQSLADSVMGNWTYGYDFQNRLVSAQASTNTDTNYAPYGSGILTWVYDSFGNYKGQTLTGTTQAMVKQGTYAYDVNNRSLDTPPDASGNLPQAGNSSFTYDAEGRVDAANGQVTYIYDAEGRRVAKGIQTAGSGGRMSVTLTNMYLLGVGGEQMSETDGQGNWLHTNAFSSGKMLATYDSRGLHFHFTDWLGSRRIQASGTGQIEETCQNLPFGDSLNCLGSGVDATEHHFTGKERDAESGLDYFGARYYSSSMGRFSSPDPSELMFADPTNPQTLNLYAYALNNPLKNTDPTGLFCYYGDTGGGAQEAADEQDSTQWDYHSSSSECSGNGGQWTSDGETHQAANGDMVDNDNRPNLYTMNTGQTAGLLTGGGALMLGAENAISAGSYLLDIPIYLLNSMSNPTAQINIPYFRLFGTHDCGPGGGGGAYSDIGKACQQHDNAYGKTKIDFNVNFQSNNLTMTPAQIQAAQAANQALYDAAGQSNTGVGKVSLQFWLTGQAKVPFSGGAYTIYPGTEAHPH